MKKFSTNEPKNLEGRIRIVTLDNPYINIQSQEVQALFSSLLAVKAKGYGPPNYPETYLTFDTADFIAWHHIFAMETESGLEVIGGYKNITLERCNFYQITPPYYGLLHTPQAKRHRKVMDELFERQKSQQKHLIFSSGFTIKEELRGSEFSKKVKGIVAALMLHDSSTLGNAPMIGVGVPRFKTERLWDQIGYQVMEDQEGPLPSFPLVTSNQEPILLMKVEEFSDWAKQSLDTHRDLISNRRVITRPAVARDQSAA